METIEDIVRKVAEEMLNTSMQDITAEVINGWAIRLGDAATCSKSSQVGNTAKMRKALEGVRDWLVVHNAYVDTEREIVKLNAALSAPPRNCDLYATPKEAGEAFISESCENPCGNCTVSDECHNPLIHECGVNWLFAEAKGEVK